MVAQDIQNIADEGLWLVGANEPPEVQFEHYLYQALDNAPQDANPYRYDPPEHRDRHARLFSFREFQNLPQQPDRFGGVDFSLLTFQ
jgi:hypothetical protein